MARKTLNRKALRAEAEAAEEAGLLDENEELDEDSEDEDEDGEGKPKKKAAKAKRKSKAKSKEPSEVRLKLYWGVYNYSMKRVALYDYSQKRQAEQKAAELSQPGKTHHFVSRVKEPIKDE
jgi:hypothetical protein